MQVIKKFLLMLLGWSFYACSSYAPTALTPNHPAHPDAAVGMAGPPSMTLADAASDAPSQTKPVAAADEERTEHDAHGNAQGTTPKVATGVGKVIAVVPGASQVVVEHGEIKGFMDAMTMGYRVEPKQLLDPIKAGDKVRFSIDVEKKIIVRLEKIP